MSSIPSKLTPKEIWQNAKAELELQLPRATYDTWLRDAHCIAYEDGEFVIGVSNSFAVDWLNSNNLRPLIKRTLARLQGQAVEIRFVVRPQRVRDETTKPAPLLETITDTDAPAKAEVPGNGHQQLNSRYTFATFVVGNSNRLACAAAQTVAERPGRAYNPFFIYGGVGLGKTHLLHSIGHATRQRGYQTLYVPAEGFTNDFIESLRHDDPETFRGKYRTIDVLLLDDIQFIAGKEGTQEELFHTFNALYMAGKQIVLCADSMPDHIAALEKRLRSRFRSGLCVDLKPPNLETRLAILQAKVEAGGWPAVPHEVLQMIARQVPGSVRRLEGALNRVMAQAEVLGMPLTVDMAEAALQDWIPQQPAASPATILALVAAHFGVTVEELQGSGRSRHISLPRKVATLLLHEEAALNLSQTGRHLGGRDHSTVRYSLDDIRELLEADAELRRQVEALREELRMPVVVRR
ncbi:MAG: chromosomal replication initiator protein DnaA [Chloroflexi bacterium]|nr:chromosomal replication initiator protein DnaA [Chloroflexota bacterium]